MEFNAVPQYRPSSSNRSYTIPPIPSPHSQHSQPSPHMIYPYGTMQQQQQQQQQNSQALQPHSRSSPPYPTWAVPQSHQPYQPMHRGLPTSREEHEQLMAKPIVTDSHSPALSTATFRQEPLSATDYFPGVIDTSPWGQKVCDELEAFPPLDPDMTEFNHQGLMSHDENTPIIDLRQYHGMEQQQRDADHLSAFNPHQTRRLSESSFSMSSTGGGLQDVSTYEDMGSSEAVSYASDCEPWNSLEPPPSLLSPLASPRRPQHDHVVRGGSRSRVSPAPHNNVRSSPYTLESSRFKRWSTGHAPTSTPVSSRALAQVGDRFAPYGPRLNPHHSMPAYSPTAMANFGLHTQNVLYSQSHPLQSSNPAMFASPDQPYPLEVPRPLPSQGLFRLLQSNADRHGGCASHFADLSDPPDLYSSLHEEPCNPPESDMNPSDPDLVPHEQDLRFNGDLYTPRWVRGHGNKREGWCGLCKPGRWLVLKNSAFWYDKSFTHGVSAATGAAFQGPQRTRRTEGNLDVWEGLCGSCNEWIALVSSKKKGTTWFRHAYKCHTHPKVKDGPKRRRETNPARARATSSASASSSSYPIKHDTPNTSAPTSHAHSHSTPGSATVTTPQQQYIGMPVSTPMTQLQPSAAYPTPGSTALPTSRADVPKQEPIVGLFGSPLQSLPAFSSSGNPTIPVSEPELVGVRMSTPMNSLAGMI